jgi:hypothetical protein
LVNLGSNTDLNFDLLNILNLKWPVFIGLTSILAYSIGLFILIRKTLKLFDGQFVSDAAWFVFMNLIICFILQIISNSQNYFENYWMLIFSSAFFCLKKLDHHNLAFGLVINIFLISLISSIILNTYISKIYNQELNVLSIKLSEKTDATLDALGGEFVTLDAKKAKEYGIAGGVVVKKINTSGGALNDQTRMKDGFVILKVNDRDVNNVDEMRKIIGNEKSVTISGFYPGYDGLYEYPITLE